MYCCQILQMRIHQNLLVLLVGGSSPAAFVHRIQPNRPNALGMPCKELGSSWNLRWIAADHTREISLEQWMERWITQDNYLNEVRLQIADKSEDPQLVSQLHCCGQHMNTLAAHVLA